MRNEGNRFDKEGDKFLRKYMDLSPPSPMKRTNLEPRGAAKGPLLGRAPLAPKLSQENQKSSGVKKRAF